ncbi:MULTISPECIES: YrhA family protein [Listeria]|uniref:YrhA family protein n=1 Tax=Listeria TaxID=1637 RepID=UPI000B594FD2|nr:MULTISPECIES: YrhA family protein [Listeria]
MLIDTISKVKKVMEEFNRTIPDGATLREIELFKKWALNNFGESVPWKDYVPFLQEVNSLQFNGVFLYGIGNVQENLDLVENNKIWHDVEEQKKYLFFGDGDISWYVWDCELDEFQQLDKPSGEVYEIYDSLDEMLIEALEVTLP